MARIPTLTTTRLVLRPFTLADAPAVQVLAGAPELASTTLAIPHPYEDGMAEEWIRGQQLVFDEGTALTFAVTLAASGELIGAAGLMNISREHERAELGYWIAVPHWGRGFCTEGARAVLRFAFDNLALHRVHARHMARNPASGRVLVKIGMLHEGVERHQVRKWGVFEDLECYGVLEDEWRRAAAAGTGESR